MKFSKMEYKRPELEPTKQQLNALIEDFEKAQSADEAFAVYKKIDDFQAYFNTMYSLAYVRHTLDTNDAYYLAESDYFDEAAPEVEEYSQRLNLALINCPFRADMEAAWGELMFKNIEISLKTFSPEIIGDLQAENKLVKEYDMLLSSAQIDFDGKKLTLAQLSPYHENEDRAIRKASMQARANWFMSHGETLDRIYDDLVKVRTAMAVKLGYESYIELGYYRMRRNCYDADMVSRFREGIKKFIVPISNGIKAEQAQRIGVEAITVYDDSFEYPDGNAKPFGTPDEILEWGRTMYHELSGDTAEFIDFMLENELFDVLTRPGKHGGVYCTEFPIYKTPFIFANFNGTSGDVDVLTHEAGHAFAFYCARDVYPHALQEITMETAEVHSMSMEFFTWPWMEGFFGDSAGKYYQSHLSSALTFLPYGTMVDDFQHRVYENPEMTPKQRNDTWLELESVYRPYLELEGFPFYGEGRRWQAQSHIFQSPFYYIDYCLAQTMALAFWAEDQKDHEAAWAKYRIFVSLAGTKTFVELVDTAGLPSPFVTDNLKIVAGAASEWLDK